MWDSNPHTLGSRAGTALVCAAAALPVAAPLARADFYGSYYGYGGYSGYSRYGAQTAPIISLELDPQKSLNSAFRVAAREGRYDDVERFIKLGAQINAPSDRGMTAMMYAARGCYPDEVRLLIDNRGNVNLRDSRKRTALMYAVTESCESSVRLLLKAPGIDLGMLEETGKTAADLASEAASEDVDGAPAEIEWLVHRATERAGRRETGQTGPTNRPHQKNLAQKSRE